ncbi:MAG: hypothetical protein ACOX9E_01630 [Lentisphaeria bacterium]
MVHGYHQHQLSQCLHHPQENHKNQHGKSDLFFSHQQTPLAGKASTLAKAAYQEPLRDVGARKNTAQSPIKQPQIPNTHKRTVSGHRLITLFLRYVLTALPPNIFFLAFERLRRCKPKAAKNGCYQWVTAYNE